MRTVSRGVLLKRVAVGLVVASLALTPLGAIAQEEELTQYASLDQLGQIIDGFTAGAEVEGVIFSADQGAGAAIVSQFQITANLVGSGARGREGVEFIPTGFDPQSETVLVNLEDVFDGPIPESGIIPPLAPLSRDGNDGLDISALFEDWAAYGERGPIDGDVRILASVHTIWGVELVEPIDPTCPTTRFVGRSWMSESFSGPDPLFTVEELDETYRGTHGALAGSGGRLIELICSSGGPPVVIARRMTDDGGLASFGPTSTVAFVRDNYVVFFVQVGELDGDLHQHFYASAADGGPVLVSEADNEPLLLVPNPYDTYNTRLTIVMDGEGATARASESGASTLLYRGSNTVALASSDDCEPSTRDFYFEDTPFGPRKVFYTRDTSTLGQIFGDGDTIVLQPNPDSAETLTVNGVDGTVDIDTGFCQGTGTALVDGQPLSEAGGAAEPTETDDGSDPADEDADDAVEGSTTDEGLPWGPIGIVLGLLAIVTALSINRRRGKKDCEPERQAYAAATAAHDQAAKAKASRNAKYERLRGEHSDLSMKIDHSLPEPRRGAFDNSPAGEAQYQDYLAEWQAQEAAAAEAEAALAGATAAMEGARAARDEADAAERTAWEAENRARIALSNCLGSPLEVDLDDIDIPPATGGDEADPGGGTPIPPSAPGIVDEPSEPAEPELCKDGARKEVPDDKLSRDFTVLAGNVIMDSPMASWDRLMGGPNGIAPQAFLGLDDGDFEDALADFDSQGKKVRIHPKIEVKTITVRCARVLVCESNTWVDTGETVRLPDFDGPLRKEHVGEQTANTQKSVISSDHVSAVRVRLAELEKSKAAYDSFECD